MKPVKSLVFWITTSVVLLVFIIIFAYWTSTMVTNFRSLSSSLDPTPSPPFSPLKVEEYQKLFPES